MRFGGNTKQLAALERLGIKVSPAKGRFGDRVFPFSRAEQDYWLNRLPERCADCDNNRCCICGSDGCGARCEKLVYAIQADGLSGPVKLGVSDNPRKRLHAIRVGSPQRAALIAVAPGGERRERDLHRELAAQQLTGEWFEFTPRVRDEVLLLFADGERHSHTRIRLGWPDNEVTE